MGKSSIPSSTILDNKHRRVQEALLRPARPIHRHDTHAHYIYHPAKTFHHLVGSHSGDNVIGIKDVKSYLQYFGYLNNHKDINYRYIVTNPKN
ncbi:hypothetical protein QQ045_006105 [Rhodiola kirilowii]